MARPLRLEFPGALYHVTSRGDGREDIYLSDDDRSAWLAVLGQVCVRFNWVCHAYCLMTNHYHIVIETPDANLSKGMRQLNGVYTQSFNRAHARGGHVFQGRFKAILVNGAKVADEATKRSRNTPPQSTSLPHEHHFRRCVTRLITVIVRA